MSSNQSPDFYKLKNTQDVRALFRLLRHHESAVRSDAAQALGTMSLNPRELKKAHKKITSVLKKDEGLQGSFKPDPVDLAKYKHALILLERPEHGIALMGLFKIWFKAYSELLIHHERQHGGSFKLAQDSDRARMARVEQVAKQVIKLGSEIATDAKTGIGFAIVTVGYIDLLVNIEGLSWLTIEEHEGHHDWSRSREVYKKMCELMTDITHLKLGLDNERWKKLGNNLIALMLAGDVETVKALNPGSKMWSAIAKRTDLPAPSPDMYATFLET